MSDNYCPPPDGEDYLQEPIVYPVPVGKESTKAADGDHNDISYDDPKQDKNMSNELDLSDGLSNQGAQKAQVAIRPTIAAKTEKAASQISSTQTRRTGKAQKPILPLGYQRSQKAVNII